MKKIFLLVFSFLFLTLIFPRAAFAAKFNLDPLSKSAKVGEQFDIKINLDTQSKEVNGAQAKLSFNKDLIEVSGVSFSGIFPTNYQYIDNNAGYVEVGSTFEQDPPSFNGNSTWVTLKIKGKTNGTADLRFSCPISYIFEYQGNNILDCSSLSAGIYTITEENQPPPGDGGDGEDGDGDEEPPSSCTDSSPDTPTNLGAASGPNNGEVTLTWTKVDADYYALVFGGASRAYEYGAANIGNTNQYVVRSLTPGKLYYFAVVAVRGCASSGLSNEASARAKGATGGGTTAKVTPKTSPQPTPTPPYQPIGEILPEVDFPTEEEVITPTPIPIFEPEEGKPSLFRTILLILAFLLVLGGLGFGLWKLIKGRMPPPPPEIVIPEGPMPTEPSAPPTQA